MSNESRENVSFLKVQQAWLNWVNRASGKQGKSAHPRIRVSSAHHEWNHVVVPLIALAKGFFADEGLEDLELVTLESEDASIEALTCRKADFSLDAATAYALKAISEGSDIYIIAPRRGTHAFHLFGQKGMSSVRDLKGGRINAFTPGDEMTVQAAQVVRDAGMVPDVDVKVTFYAGNMHDIFGMENSFRRGETQGLLAADVQVERLKSDGYPVLVNLQKTYLPRQDRVILATGNMVNDHHDTVKAFIKGIIRGNRFFLNKKNRQEITDIVQEAGFVIENRQLFDSIFDSLYTRIPANCHLPLEGVEQAVKEQIAAGHIGKNITTDKIVKIKPLQEAQNELGVV